MEVKFQYNGCDLSSHSNKSNEKTKIWSNSDIWKMNICNRYVSRIIVYLTTRTKYDVKYGFLAFDKTRIEK